MHFFTVVVGCLLAVFSTAVMGYISMATPIGPWIAPTLVLFASVIFKLIYSNKSSGKNIVLATATGSIGGILAVACGFSFPTLYFLDKSLFNSWLASPVFFVSALAALSISAGMLGFWLADLVQVSLIEKQNLSFPIGQLVYKMISSQKQLSKAKDLFFGLGGGIMYGIFQDGFIFFKGFLPKVLTLIGKCKLLFLNIPHIRITMPMLPMLWAIGFVTGHVIAVPLAVGAIAKIIILDPINTLFFQHIQRFDFILAFCSGMVLAGAVSGFIATPKALWKTFKDKRNGKKTTKNSSGITLTKGLLVELCIVLAIIFCCLSYFKFSFISQVYLIVFSLICAYQIVVIAGKIGLAQLGRFATFVMIPAMFMFGLNFVQLVILSTFVEIVGGVAADVLFSRKVAVLSGIKIKVVRRYQLLGLVVSSIAIGIVFWLLITSLGLGSAELFAQRAQARSLLINFKCFDIYVLIIGFVFGYILKKIRISPMLVLGGLLMPIDISLGLILGGASTLLFKDKESLFPFASGMFAANSLWVLGQAAASFFK